MHTESNGNDTDLGYGGNKKPEGRVSVSLRTELIDIIDPFIMRNAPSKNTPEDESPPRSPISPNKTKKNSSNTPSLESLKSMGFFPQTKLGSSKNTLATNMLPIFASENTKAINNKFAKELRKEIINKFEEMYDDPEKKTIEEKKKIIREIIFNNSIKLLQNSFKAEESEGGNLRQLLKACFKITEPTNKPKEDNAPQVEVKK
ncbi:MAG: hypothetical protein NTU49_08635 [Gammaproteobacteria bacterium]|nr:hypothetical protein [Gammaproteobacteria bacterium]